MATCHTLYIMSPYIITMATGHGFSSFASVAQKCHEPAQSPDDTGKTTHIITD